MTDPSSSDPQVVERVLTLLRRWGWEAAGARLREEIQAAADPKQRAELEMLMGWLTAERGEHEQADALFEAAGVRPELKAWALVGRAYIAYRGRQYDRARETLGMARRCGGESDTVLLATLHHLQGALAYAQGRPDDALTHLYAALDTLGLDHFGAGRILDSLGMVYGSLNDFATAMLFYQRAEELKRRASMADTGLGDLAGLAVTYGQLGRLHLDRAEEYFREDLRLCERIRDRRGEAQMHNHLGQVDLRRGKARRACEYLDVSVRCNQAGGWVVGEGYARKDRAAALVALGKLDEAGADLEAAEGLFGKAGFGEGLAHVGLVRGKLLAALRRDADGAEALRGAAVWFDDDDQPAEAARAYLELARLRQRGGGAVGLAREALLAALERADRSRRDSLIAAVERELAEVDEVELYKRLYLRARGRGIRDDIGTLERATGERATVLFLDLRESTVFVMREDPAVVRLTINQLFAELTEVLVRHNVVINQYLGDGFMALARAGNHAVNAVAGGLEVFEALARFNRPRKVLGMRPLEARVGISTGDVILGNIGTHQKVDFTAVGPTTNVAARLQGKARPGMVCVSESTWKVVQERFEFDDRSGREEELAGVGKVRVWDVKGRKSG